MIILSVPKKNHDCLRQQSIYKEFVRLMVTSQQRLVEIDSPKPFLS